MELREKHSYRSEFKLKFKTAFADLMGTVDLVTGEVGRGELEIMKERVSELRESRVKELGPEYSRRDLSFVSGVGQVSLSRNEGVDVSIEGYSNRYEGNIPYVSSAGKASSEDLTDVSFIKRQIEDAAKNSDVYKSLKIQVAGVSQMRSPGGYDEISKLDIGIHTRTEDLFFLSLLNRVSYSSNRMAVFMSDVKPNTLPMENVDPDYLGFDTFRKAYVVRTALSSEMVLGKKYNHLMLKK
jgi:hypothetical protein